MLLARSGSACLEFKRFCSPTCLCKLGKRQDGQEAPGARKPDSLDSKLQTSGLGSEWREARVSNVGMQVTEAGTGASRPLLDAQ